MTQIMISDRDTLFKGALLAALAVTLYFAFSNIEDTIVDELNDKFSHVLAFATLAFLADFAFSHRSFDLHKIAALLLLGMLIEAVQHFIPYRTASFFDVLADSIGIAAYYLARPIVRQVPWLKSKRAV